ncbi:MAG: DUF4097 domain-containing protein [Bacilli bacterium]|nr:DUF4097 domain-containing protein [Bacilli bacterium]
MKKKALLLSPLVLLSSCNFNGSISISYKNENLYIVGNLETEENISSLDINYISGDINIVYSSDSKFTVVEKTKKEINEEQMMRYYLSNETLFIQPAKSGITKYDDVNRELEIKVPTSYSLSSIKINSVSSDINLVINSTEFEINTVSGSINMEVESFSLIDCDTVSTDAEIKIKNDIGVTVDFNSVSGKLTNNISNTNDSQKIKYNTVSGNLRINK